MTKPDLALVPEVPPDPNTRFVQHTCGRCSACLVEDSGSDLSSVVDVRETLIAQGFASLVAIVGVLRAIGGFLRPEQQAALFEAERIIALAKVTE